MLDIDSVRTPTAFALIELFLTCPPNKLAVRSYNVRARRWDSTKQSYSRHRSEPRSIRREKTIYWSEARVHIFQSVSKHDRFIPRKLNSTPLLSREIFSIGYYAPSYIKRMIMNIKLMICYFLSNCNSNVLLFKISNGNLLLFERKKQLIIFTK